MSRKKKVIKAQVETEQNLWERFKDFVKNKKGVTLKKGHSEALKKYMGEPNDNV